MLVLGRNALGERGVSHAFGMSRKGGGVWIPAHASMLLDFEKNRHFGAKPSLVRSSKAWDFDAAGNLYQAENNILRRVNGRGALIEPPRTNMVRNSEATGGAAGSPGNMPTFWSFSGGNPTGVTRTLSFGVMNGVPGIYLRFEGTPTTGPGLGLNMDSTTAIPAAAGQTWTGSVYLALVAGSLSGMGGLTFRATRGFTSTGGVSNDSTGTSIIAQVDATLKRFVGTNTLSAADTAFATPQLLMTFAAGVYVDFTLFIALPSMAQATFASSPILSSGVAVTRAGDILGAPISPGGRAFIFKFELLSPTNTGTFQLPLSFSNGSNTDRYYVGMASADGATTLQASAAGVNAGSPTGTPPILPGLNILYGVVSPAYRRLGKVGSVDSQVAVTPRQVEGINTLGLGGNGYNTTSNSAMNVKMFSEAHLTEFASPADAYDWAKAEALKWAA